MPDPERPTAGAGSGGGTFKEAVTASAAQSDAPTAVGVAKRKCSQCLRHRNNIPSREGGSCWMDVFHQRSHFDLGRLRGEQSLWGQAGAAGMEGVGRISEKQPVVKMHGDARCPRALPRARKPPGRGCVRREGHARRIECQTQRPEGLTAWAAGRGRRRRGQGEAPTCDAARTDGHTPGGSTRGSPHTDPSVHGEAQAAG